MRLQNDTVLEKPFLLYLNHSCSSRMPKQNFRRFKQSYGRFWTETI